MVILIGTQEYVTGLKRIDLLEYFTGKVAYTSRYIEKSSFISIIEEKIWVDDDEAACQPTLRSLDEQQKL